MAFSRMPKCRVRPYGPPFHSAVCLPAGTNDGSPFIVVLFDSARSAEPPQSSGRTSARAPSTCPEAARVAMPFSSASKVGRAWRSRSGSSPAPSRSSSAARSGLALRQALKPWSHSRWAALPRFATSRAWARTAAVDLEGLRRVEAEDLLGGGDLVRAERRAVGGLPVPRADGAGQRDDGAEHDERGRRRDRRLFSSAARSGVDVLGVAGGARGVLALPPVDLDDVPAVGLEALADVLAEGDVGVVLDRDLVGVVDDGEVGQLLVPGERAGLGGDALHEVAVGGDAPRRGGRRGSPGRGVGVEHARAGGAGPSPCPPRRPAPSRAGRS